MSPEALGLPEDVHASTQGHPGFHETIHRYLNLISAGGVGGKFEIGHTGDLDLQTGHHYFEFEADATLVGARYTLGTKPTGSAAEFDIILHAAGGGSASIFDAGNEPTIAAGTGRSSGLWVPDTLEADAGDAITFNRTAIGSTTPGADLLVVLYWIYR